MVFTGQIHYTALDERIHMYDEHTEHFGWAVHVLDEHNIATEKHRVLFNVQ